MMIFMLVAVVFMIKVEAEADDVRILQKMAEQQAQRMKGVAELYDETRERIYNDLLREFRAGFKDGVRASIENLAFRFEEPKVLFDCG